MGASIILPEGRSLAGSSPFEALDVAVYQMVNFRQVNAAAQAAAQSRAAQVDLDRIHSIGEWLDDQNIENSKPSRARAGRKGSR